LKKGILIPIIIFAVAFFVRALYVMDYDALPVSDASHYDTLAISLSEGKGFVDPNGEHTSWRAPLYPFFLSLIYRFAGHDYLVVRLIQALIWSLTCILIYLIGKRCFGHKVGIIAAGISVFYIGFIHCAALLLTETLFSFFLAIIIFCIISAEKYFSLVRLIVIGIILALSSLMRSATVLMPIFILALFLAKKEFNFRRSLQYFLIMTATMCIVIMPWTIRNYMVHHAFVPIATQGGITFYSSYKPPQGKIIGLITNDEVTRRASEIKSEAQRDKFLYRETFKFIRHNPLKVLKLSILKLGYFISPFDWEITSSEGRYNYQYAFFIIFSIVGTFAMLRQKRRYAYTLLLPAVYLLIIAIIFQGSPRHRLAAEPCLIILAAFGIATFYKRIRNKYIAVVAMVTILFVNYIFYLNNQSFKFAVRDIFKQIGLW